MNWILQLDNGGSEIQIDEVGNIYQQGGGVIPKACQKCKQPFHSEVIKTEVTQPVPLYKCQDCNFTSSTGDGAFDHTLEQSLHKIIKTTSSRIVGYNNTLQGVLSYITKTEDDVIILCGECNNVIL